MLTVLYIISYLLIGLIIYACVAGDVRIVRAFQAGDKPKAKRLMLGVVRVCLILAGLIIIVATHGRGMKIAQILLIIMLSLGLPNAVRVLSGYGHQPKPLP